MPSSFSIYIYNYKESETISKCIFISTYDSSDNAPLLPYGLCRKP